MLVWLCLVKVQICIWPSLCYWHSLSLTPVNPDWFYLPGLTFQCRLTRVVLGVCDFGYLGSAYIATIFGQELFNSVNYNWDLPSKSEPGGKWLNVNYLSYV